MIQRLTQTKKQGLVMLPTRELAIQVDEVLRRISKNINLKTAVLIGGLAIGPQIRAIKQNPTIIVATPGRLLDHLKQQTLRLDNVSIVVLDEADRMLDMGFAPAIERILRTIPKNRQTMLFSATMPPAIMKLATAHMKLPIRIEIAPSGSLPERVTQEIFIIQKNVKNRLLEKVLERYPDTTLIFTRTKYTASRLARTIRAMGHNAAEIHSGRSLAQRREALEGFKSGKYRVLVATDIASRGIQVIGIGLVLNYDAPTNPEDYVHRIGRTARAGAGGHAISFITPEQRGELRSIERLIQKNLPISRLPELPSERPPLRQNSYPQHRRRPFPPRRRS
jgi:ATP-dependent RNA helicase RhlE